MTKTIFIHENKDCFFVNREVGSADDLPVSYWPVYKVEKNNFELKTFSEVIDKSFENAGEIISTLFVGADGGGYEDFLNTLQEKFETHSLTAFKRKNNQFQIDKDSDVIEFHPTIYKRGGYYPDEENQRKINVQGKSSLEIGEDIYNLIQEYHKAKVK